MSEPRTPRGKALVRPYYNGGQAVATKDVLAIERQAFAIAEAERVCGYEDPFGGPCLLTVEGHPRNPRTKRLIHNDGKWRR